MDRGGWFGDNVGATLLKLALLSIVVGVVFSALGITPENLVERLAQIIRNLTNLSLDAINWALKYFLLGAVIVFPIWIVVRLVRGRNDPRA
jgi:Na+/H+-dicarboxylate symporter